MTKIQLLRLLRKECEKAGSQAAWAKAHEMPAPTVSNVLFGKRKPTEKIMRALKVEPVTTYRKIK